MAAKVKNLTLFIGLIISMVSLISLSLGVLIGERFAPGKLIREVEYRNVTRTVFAASPLNINEVSIYIPAVGSSGQGSLANLSVIVREGTGLILVNINDVLADYDTQFSARTAALVAAEYAKVDMGEFDIIYTINADSQFIGGPSAGAAMSVATLAALTHASLDPGTIMTGTINPDGSIGMVSGIFQKAYAAKSAGLKRFLVPVGESFSLNYKEERICQDIRGNRYCTLSYVPERVDIAKNLNIEIVEVADIGSAMKFFTQQ